MYIYPAFSLSDVTVESLLALEPFVSDERKLFVVVFGLKPLAAVLFIICI